MSIKLVIIKNNSNHTFVIYKKEHLGYITKYYIVNKISLI